MFSSFSMTLETAHTVSANHSDTVRQSQHCGCFYCLATFEPKLISEWVDDSATALCPFCGIDAVIGDASGFPITKPFLSAMNKYWFADEIYPDDDEDADENEVGM